MTANLNVSSINYSRRNMEHPWFPKEMHGGNKDKEGIRWISTSNVIKDSDKLAELMP